MARVSGGAGLRNALGQLVTTVESECREVVRESAEALVAGTRRRVAVDTGRLYRDVDAHYAPDGLSAEVGWFDPDDYYAEFVEHGTSSQPAQPALGPAADEERRELPNRVARHLRRRLGQ
ncbi:MAG TPA: HK97-gp10 family putative phage morphogenesis protein [Micromonosporaceae bacterium]|nr:HK97-gp10 family putative phage morphogenesis protein [Micromonosporaceae bacterium]